MSVGKSFLRGTKEVGNRLRQISRMFPDKVAAALYQEAQEIMTESKRRCPVAPDGGTLRASGFVHKPERHGRRISVELSYGGAAIAYALAVHEHLSEHSPPSWVAAEEHGQGVTWNVGGPKYLESAVNEAVPELSDKIGKRVAFNNARAMESAE